jgi:hypothetical protein
MVTEMLLYFSNVREQVLDQMEQRLGSLGRYSS